MTIVNDLLPYPHTSLPTPLPTFSLPHPFLPHSFPPLSPIYILHSASGAISFGIREVQKLECTSEYLKHRSAEKLKLTVLVWCISQLFRSKELNLILGSGQLIIIIIYSDKNQ